MNKSRKTPAPLAGITQETPGAVVKSFRVPADLYRRVEDAMRAHRVKNFTAFALRGMERLLDDLEGEGDR